MKFMRPRGILAGFHAESPDPEVLELLHAGEQWLPMHHRIGRHQHTVWEFYQQIDGRSHWRSDRVDAVLAAGDFFAAPPGVAHELLNHPTGKHHFFFAAIDLGPVLRRLPALSAAWKVKDCLHARHAEGVEAPFRHLIREICVHLPHRTEALRAAVDALVIEASRAVMGSVSHSVAFVHPGVELVCAALDHHCEQPWRLAELGRLAGVSPHHLVTLFSREVGVPPRQYLLRRRIDRAKDMLRDSDVAITSIALDLGFSSSQHFAKIFHQMAGVSALAWRRRHQKG